jgi:hypothetical protein
MRLTLLCFVVTLAVLPMVQGQVSAQAPTPGATSDPPTASPSTSTSTSSVATPLSPNAPAYSVDRVRRELRQVPRTTTVEKQDGLKLEYYIQVFGSAPKVDFFKNYNLKTGTIPWGAPTHADMLEQMTPQEYRKPVADIPSMLIWLGQQLSKKK